MLTDGFLFVGHENKKKKLCVSVHMKDLRNVNHVITGYLLINAETVFRIADICRHATCYICLTLCLRFEKLYPPPKPNCRQIYINETMTML